jgi:putative membrane protein
MTDVYSSMLHNALAAVLFAVIGVVLFILAFILFDRLTPGSLWKEIIEDQNTALGVLMGAVAIALAIIIAAAVH